jgi:hypothetical protein
MKEHFWQKWFCREREEKPFCRWYLLLSVNNVQEHPWARNTMRCCNYSWMPAMLPLFLSSPPGSVTTRKAITSYRVIQEESAILWEMIVCVILSKKVHMNMGPILNLIWH